MTKNSPSAQCFDTAQRFFVVLTGLSDPIVRVRFVHDSDRVTNPVAEREGTLTQLWSDILEHQTRGYAVFYFLNVVKCGPGSGYGGSANDDDVTAIRALATDHDTGLPDESGWHLRPALVVRTSQVTSEDRTIQKGQAIWPVYDLPKSDFKSAQLCLAAHYGADISISNPSRVLRLPGTLHLKDPGHPQLVTFEDLTEGAEHWEYALNAERVFEGLPAALGQSSRTRASSASGPPVEREHLRMVVGYLDPNVPRSQWRDNVAAIHATPVVGDDDGSVRRQIAHEYSEGKLDRTGQYADQTPSNYSGSDDVDDVFDTMRPRAGGVGYGTIYHRAKEAGYDGPPSRPSATETFRGLRVESVDVASQPSETNVASPAPFLMSERDIFALPDPEELVVGFLMKGENVCFYGPPKVGKTFIALDIALSLAADLPVFGNVATNTSGSVVYLSGEGHAGMKRRVKSWRKARGIAPDRELPFYYKASVPMTKDGVAEAQRYVEGIQKYLGLSPVLVVIDTMARSMAGLDENSSGDAGRYLELTETLRAGLSCTMLTLAHSGKRLDHGLRGSTAFAAGFDAVWVAEMNDANKTVKLDAEYLKDAEDLGPFCFRLRQIEVEGMELGKGAVLEHVPLAEFKQTVSDDEANTARKRIAEALHQHGVFGLEKGLDTRHLAEILAGPPPRATERKATREWETKVAKEAAHLDNGSRVRHKGKRALFEGYFEKTVREGGQRLIRVWSLPEASAAKATAEEEY